MKPSPHFRSALFVGLVFFAGLIRASGQTPAPTASVVPASKPATETASPSPGATVTASTPAETTTTVRKDILDKYDKNHDGVLDADEQAAYEKDRAARKAERLRKYDKNHDGKLDETELAAMRADRKKEQQANDKNKTSPTP